MDRPTVRTEAPTEQKSVIPTPARNGFREGLKTWLLIASSVLIVIAPLAVWYHLTYSSEEYMRSWSKKFVQPIDGGLYVPPARVAACQVLGLELHGTLLTYLPADSAGFDGTVLYDYSTADYLTSAIRAAEKDETIKGILLSVDSPGGYPVAGEEIARSLRAATKPTVAVIRQLGASAAYLAAAGADRIFASDFSDVGSLGLTYSYIDNAKKNKEDGLTFNQLSTGTLKDAGNPDKPLTAEERKVFERNLRVGLERLSTLIAKYRNIPKDKVEALATGDIWSGSQAKEHGLIDELGDRGAALEYLKRTLKLETTPDICW